MTMHKKFFGLILVLSGILLTALFYWNPGSISEVNIQPRQESAIKKLLEEKIQHTIGGYQDIAYRIKENVARCVILVRHQLDINIWS